MAIEEPYGAGIFEDESAPRFVRLANGQKRFWEFADMPVYGGGKLYPSGRRFSVKYGIYPYFSPTYYVEESVLKPKDEALNKIAVEEFFTLKSLVFNPKLQRHLVGGDGFVHSIPNYGRVVKEGLNSYAARVENMPEGEIKRGLKIILDGIRIYHTRALKLLREQNGDAELISALEKVPFSPAENIYEALVCWNFIYYIDSCDNPGRLDNDLNPYHKGEDVTAVIRELFQNVDANDGWTCALGPDYNELTKQCLVAIRGIRRPNVELRVTKDMPQEIWDTAKATLLSMTGHPALYNEELYQKKLAEFFPEMPAEDRKKFCGGGCTETMFAGISNVGSLDAGINLLYILEDMLYRRLPEFADFESFYAAYLREITAIKDEFVRELNRYEKDRATFRPQPVRTLLIDDCIDRNKDFYGGGARWHFSILNYAGFVNAADSLLAVKELVFDKRVYGAREFARELKAQTDEMKNALRRCPCYGIDDDVADGFAARFARDLVALVKNDRDYLGGKIVTASIQFTTYLNAGKGILPTPDGREENAPLCDSLGAIYGKDRAGAVAMLNSVTKLPLGDMIGTPVLNLRLQKGYLDKAFEGLVKGYFARGGMQMQITCMSKEEMLDALDHPERHRSLIVRTGGYAEYFVNLDREFQETLIKRTEFSE